MEPAFIINIIMSFVLVLIGWFMRILWGSVKRLQADMAELNTAEIEQVLANKLNEKLNPTVVAGLPWAETEDA